MTYIQDPNDDTKVIDISIKPPSIDPQDLEQQVRDLDNKMSEPQKFIDNLKSQKAKIQAQLDAIYADVPEVKPLENN